MVSFEPVNGTHTGGCGCVIGPRPDRDVLVGPELALVGELRLGPGLEDDLDRLLEARPRFRHRHAIDVVFARHAAGEAGQDAPARHGVGHRQLLGDAERIVQRHQIAEHQELQLLGPLRADRRHHVRRVHHAVRRGVVLVQADAVEAELVHLLPGLQMLFVGPRRDLAIVVIERQRIGQILGRFVLIEVLSVGEQVEDEDFHYRFLSVSTERRSLVRHGRACPGHPRLSRKARRGCPAQGRA